MKYNIIINLIKASVCILHNTVLYLEKLVHLTGLCITGTEWYNQQHDTIYAYYAHMSLNNIHDNSRPQK